MQFGLTRGIDSRLEFPPQRGAASSLRTAATMPVNSGVVWRKVVRTATSAMVKANDLDFELVAKADAVTLYVNDHGKPECECQECQAPTPATAGPGSQARTRA